MFIYHHTFKIILFYCNKIDSSSFENVITHINNIYADAEQLSARTYLENCLSCLTAYTLLLCMPTYYEKVKKYLLDYLKFFLKSFSLY